MDTGLRQVMNGAALPFVVLGTVIVFVLVLVCFVVMMVLQAGIKVAHLGYYTCRFVWLPRLRWRLRSFRLGPY